jgi:hypothetical protein
MRAVDVGSLKNTLDVTIDHRNAQRGVMVKTAHNGPAFKTVTLNRGRPMGLAGET